MTEAQQSQQLRIKVKTLPEGSYELDIQNNLTVDQLKDRLQEVTTIQKSRQRLIYRGRALQDTQTVTELGIEDGHVLHLVERPENAPPPIQANDQGQQQQQQQQQQQGRTRGRGQQRVTINQFNLGGDQQPIQLGPGEDVGQVIGNLIQRLIPNGNQGDVQISMDNLQNLNLPGVGPDGQRPQMLTTINSYLDTLSGDNPPRGLVPPLPVPLAINQRLSPSRRVQHLTRAIQTILRDQELDPYLQELIQQGLTYRHQRRNRNQEGTSNQEQAQAAGENQEGIQDQAVPPATDNLPNLQSHQATVQILNEAIRQHQEEQGGTNTQVAQALLQNIEDQIMEQFDPEVYVQDHQEGHQGQQVPPNQTSQDQSEPSQQPAAQPPSQTQEQTQGQTAAQTPAQATTQPPTQNQAQSGPHQTPLNADNQNQSTQTNRGQQQRQRRQLAYPCMPLITYAVQYLLGRTQALVRDRLEPSLEQQIRELQNLVPQTSTHTDAVKENVHGLASSLYNYSTLMFEMARLCSSLHRALDGHGDSIMENLTTVIRQDGTRPVVDTFREYSDTTIPIAATVTQNVHLPTGEAGEQINLGPQMQANHQNTNNGQGNHVHTQPQQSSGMDNQGAQQAQGNTQQESQQQRGQNGGNQHNINVDVQSILQNMMSSIDLEGINLGGLVSMSGGFQTTGGTQMPINLQNLSNQFPTSGGPTIIPTPNFPGANQSGTNTHPQQQQPRTHTHTPSHTQTQPQPTSNATGQQDNGAQQQNNQQQPQGPQQQQSQESQTQQAGQRQRRQRRRRHSNTQTFNLGSQDFDLGSLGGLQGLPQDIQNLIQGGSIQMVPEVTAVTVEAGDEFGNDYNDTDEEDWEELNDNIDDQNIQQSQPQQAQPQAQAQSAQAPNPSTQGTSSSVENLFATYSNMGNTILTVLEAFFPALVNMMQRYGSQNSIPTLQTLQASQLRPLYDNFIADVRNLLQSTQSQLQRDSRPYIQANINTPQDVINAIQRGLPFLERSLVDFINKYANDQTISQESSKDKMDVDSNRESESGVKVEDSQGTSTLPKASGGIGKLPKRGQTNKTKSGDKDQDKKAKIDNKTSEQGQAPQQKQSQQQQQQTPDLQNLFNNFMSGNIPSQPQATSQQDTGQSSQQPKSASENKQQQKTKSSQQQQQQQQQQEEQPQPQQQQQQPPNLGNLLNSFGPMLQGMLGGQQQGGGPGAGGLNLNSILSDPNVGGMVNQMMPQVQQMLGGGNLDLSGILGGLGRPPASSQQSAQQAGQNSQPRSYPVYNQPIVEEPSDDEGDYQEPSHVEEWMHQIDDQQTRNRWASLIQTDRRRINQDEYKYPHQLSEAYMAGYGSKKQKE